MASKLLIIQPSYYQSPEDRTPVRVRRRQSVPLVLPYHIKPRYCSPRELEEDVQSIHRRFCSLPSMFRRLPLPFKTLAVASWTLNLSQRRVCADKANHFGSC